MKIRLFSVALLAFCSSVESSDLSESNIQERDKPYVRITQEDGASKKCRVITIENASDEEIRLATFKVALLATNQDEATEIISQILKKEGNIPAGVSVNDLSEDGFLCFEKTIFDLYKSHFSSEGEKQEAFLTQTGFSYVTNSYMKKFYNSVCGMVETVRHEEKRLQEVRATSEDRANHKTAKNMIEMNFDTETIAKATGLSEEAVDRLRQSDRSSS